MERKKFFTVYYNNGDGCGVEFLSEYHNYITNNYMITEYGTEVYYEDKKIEKEWEKSYQKSAIIL